MRIKTNDEMRQEVIQFCSRTNQSKAAKKIGISRAYMSDLVRGKRDVSKRVAKFFGYTVETVPPQRIYKKIVK